MKIELLYACLSLQILWPKCFGESVTFSHQFQKLQVMNLADEVEDLFIKHFSGEDRRKARKYLKPHQHKESHSVTFFIGEFLNSKFDCVSLKIKLQDNIF